MLERSIPPAIAPRRNNDDIRQNDTTASLALRFRCFMPYPSTFAELKTGDPIAALTPPGAGGGGVLANTAIDEPAATT